MPIQPSSRKISWMFDSQPNSSGDRFRTQNIPSEQSYWTLFYSVPFFEEPESSAQVTRRGLLKLYSNAQAMQGRYTTDVVRGEEKSLRSWQLPGVGIRRPAPGLEFSEPAYNYDLDLGESVSGHGITIQAVKQDAVAHIQKISYAILSDIDSAPEQIVQEIVETFGAGTLECNVNHNFNNKWVEIDVYDENGMLIETDVELIDADNVTIWLNTPGCPLAIDVVVHGVKTL